MPMIRGAAIGLFSGIIVGFLSNHNSNGATHLINTTTYSEIKNRLEMHIFNDQNDKRAFKLPLYMQLKRSKMFLMAVERLMFPIKIPIQTNTKERSYYDPESTLNFKFKSRKKIPSTALVMPISSAMQPY